MSKTVREKRETGIEGEDGEKEGRGGGGHVKQRAECRFSEVLR